jgi:hypothetical protein
VDQPSFSVRRLQWRSRGRRARPGLRHGDQGRRCPAAGTAEILVARLVLALGRGDGEWADPRPHRRASRRHQPARRAGNQRPLGLSARRGPRPWRS